MPPKPSAPDAAAIGSPDASRTFPLGRTARIVASVLIIGHLWAVIGRPLEFATQGPFGASPSMTRFRQPVRGYSQFAYLDHGYAFFAPEPGPSHLIRATVTPTERLEGGEPGPNPITPIVHNYPDLNDQWPRLLYHRHFMLAEFLNDIHHPPGEPPQEIAQNPIAVREWIQARRRYEMVRDSILNRLRTAYPQATVAIDRVEHRQPGLPEFMEDNVPLDAPQLYSVLPDAPPLPPEPLPLAPPAESPAAEASENGAAPFAEPTPDVPDRPAAARDAAGVNRPLIPRLPLRAPAGVTP